jgi:lactoylglutathione lyase
MNIDHIAIWTNDLERMKDFYEQYFNARAASKYHNLKKQYEAYFLSFSSGARLELMKQPWINPRHHDPLKAQTGYANLSIACGSEAIVNELTEKIHKDGYQLVDGPHHTGDGYYESVILDPDGNHIEITV